MQIDLDHIGGGESLLRQIREEEFIDDALPRDAHRTLLGVITFFRTIFPAKPSQIENEPGNSPLSRKQSLLASCVRTCSRER